MANPSNPQPKRSYLRAWAMLLGAIALAVGAIYLRSAGQASPVPDPEPVGHAIFMVVIGVIFFLLGVSCYFVVLFTHAFTFNFSRPVWDGVKKRMFVANLIVLLIVSSGVGILFSPFLTPLFAPLNLPGTTSTVLPVMTAVVGLQLLFVFVLVWAPLEKGIIVRRLTELGITPEQLAGGLFIGISNPGITRTGRRFWCIEEDVGMLWFTPAQMIYWGDHESFAISHEQLARMERKSDALSTTALSGTAHVILHVRLPDGNERPVRLHTEAVWTMIGKRKASDELAARVNAWYEAPPVAASN